MTDEKSLTIIEQRDVEFYGDQIIAVIAENGTIFVPVKPICDLLGVSWSPQVRRINRDAVLSTEVRSVTVTVTDLDPSSSRPRTSEMLALPLKYLNGWLFGFSPDRVAPEIRDRLIRYQRECYDVLFEAFQKQAVTAAPTIADIDVEELLRTGQDPEAQAYRMALAIANMARQQLLLRYRLETHDERLDEHAQQLGVHGARLDQIEATLGNPGRYISTAQASRVSQAVKAIALALGERSGRNEFGGVYGELYRRFEIAGYRELPAAKYDEAMAFLRQWYTSLTGKGDVPF